MNDDELRDQLERRTTSAPLAPAERVELIEAVHARTSKRARGASLWVGRLAIPLAAAATVIVFVLAVGFPRPPQTSSTSPTPGSTPTASSAATPSPSASATASASPQSGLVVLSAAQLIAMAGDPSKIGEVVVSDAVISFVPSPTQFDVPDASSQPFGTIESGGGSVVVIGQSFPDTSWPDHAFRLVEGGRVEYLGPVNDHTDAGIWTVADAIAAEPPEASNVLYAVQGWLLQTAAAPCVAPPDFSSSQDYWCGGSWLLPEKPAPPTDGTIHLQYPGAIHVQWSAYEDFAANPQPNSGLGGDPRLGVYLVQPAGCPPNVMGDCPVWEMLGRLDPPVGDVPATMHPDTTPDSEPTPTTAPTPTPSFTAPAEFQRSIEEENVGLGIRLTVSFDSNPLTAGRQTSLDTLIENIGSDVLTWSHDSCGIPVQVSGVMSDSVWSLGADQTGVAQKFKDMALGDWDGHISVPFIPERWIGYGPSHRGCDLLEVIDRIQPGAGIKQQLFWEGYGGTLMGPPPSGFADLTLRAEYFWRGNKTPTALADQQWVLQFPRFFWVDSSNEPVRLTPAEAVDAALADHDFIGWLESSNLGDGRSPVLFYEPTQDRWFVGTIDYRASALHLLGLDSSTGNVLEVIDRPWNPSVDKVP